MRELGEQMDSAEVSEWLAFDVLYGLGDGQNVIGQLGPALAAPWSKRPVSAGDFAPYFKPDSPTQSTASMHARFAAFARSHNDSEAPRGDS